MTDQKPPQTKFDLWNGLLRAIEAGVPHLALQFTIDWAEDRSECYWWERDEDDPLEYLDDSYYFSTYIGALIYEVRNIIEIIKPGIDKTFFETVLLWAETLATE